MRKIIIAGIGTGIGKTVVSAIITEALEADYWKPVQTGTEEVTDSEVVKCLVSHSNFQSHPESYSFSAPLSPHHAAKLENREIDPRLISLPLTVRPLVIEACGGILVPLNDKTLFFEKLLSFEAEWILVSHHYLGSINHTLLTCEFLRQRSINVRGLIFNGKPNPETERAILNFSGLRLLGNLFPEKTLNQTIIKRYAELWRPHLL